jgi:hypothetical protein
MSDFSNFTYAELIIAVNRYVTTAVADKDEAQKIFDAMSAIRVLYEDSMTESMGHQAEAERLLEALQKQSISNDDTFNKMLLEAGVFQCHMTAEQVKLNAALELMNPFAFNSTAHHDEIVTVLNSRSIKKLTLLDAKQSRQ